MWDRTMMGKSYFLLSLLQAAVSTEWTANYPSEVTAQRGLCAWIPCHYSYPSHLNNKPTGIWINDENWNRSSLAFHSGNPGIVSSKFDHRTWLSGTLRDGNCSLVIDNIKQEDEGPYHFRIEFNSKARYSFFPVTRLRVSDFTDKPTIFPVETVDGKPVNVTCTFTTNTMCNRVVPTFTWVTSADQPPTASHSGTQLGDTRTFTSVLSLTPSLKHHGQNLTCRVRYPTVSSEQTLTLTVQFPAKDGQTLPVIPLATAAGVLFLIILSAVICFILKSPWRTDRPSVDASRMVTRQESGTVQMRESQVQEERYETHPTRSETAQDKGQKDPKTTMNMKQFHEDIYANCPVETSIYANV
ncbi:myeloid cell surface antigen CD33-like [Rhinoraja longicauda]